MTSNGEKEPIYCFCRYKDPKKGRVGTRCKFLPSLVVCDDCGSVLVMEKGEKCQGDAKTS